MQIIVKFLIGIFIIIFIGWNRLFRTRENVNISHIVLSYYKICFILILLLYFISILYFSIRKNLNGKSETIILQNYYIKRINQLIKEYFINAPEYVYNVLTKNISFKSFIEGPISYFTAYCYYPRIIGIMFLSIPQIIVATAFIVDVLYFHELKYFFISLTCLIPYLIIKILRFIIKSYTAYSLEYLEHFLVFSDAPNGQLLISLKPKNQLPLHKEMLTPEQAIKNFNHLSDLWIINRKIHNYMTDIEAVRDHYSGYFQCYTSICYIVGWSFYLYVIVVSLL